MTPKQRRFVEEYLVDLNGTQAAIRAGYSVRTARQAGTENLAKPVIASAIAAARAERSERTQVTADRVIEELASIAFLDPIDLVAARDVKKPADIAKLPEHIRRAIAGWSWDRSGRLVLKLSAKTTALEMIGRHLGMWIDRKEVSGPGGGPIEMESPRERIARQLDRLAATVGAGTHPGEPE